MYVMKSVCVWNVCVSERDRVCVLLNKLPLTMIVEEPQGMRLT